MQNLSIEFEARKIRQSSDSQLNCRLKIPKFCGNFARYLPIAVLFTNRCKIADFAAVISNLPKNSAVIFREYDLPAIQRLGLAQEIMNYTKKFGHLFLVGKDIALALRIRADGVHFSDQDFLPLKLRSLSSRLRNFPSGFLFSYACHGHRQVLACQKFAPNLVFLSPIFTSTSHPDQKPLGLHYLRKHLQSLGLNRHPKYRIYALGGVNLQNLNQLRKLGISGFGAIDIFTKPLISKQ